MSLSGVAAHFNGFANLFEEPHFGSSSGSLNAADEANGTGTPATPNSSAQIPFAETLLIWCFAAILSWRWCYWSWNKPQAHFPPFCLLLKESLRKYFWPKSMPTSPRAMISLRMMRRRRMNLTRMVSRRSDKGKSAVPQMKMVSVFPQSRCAASFSQRCIFLTNQGRLQF